MGLLYKKVETILANQIYGKRSIVRFSLFVALKFDKRASRSTKFTGLLLVK